MALIHRAKLTHYMSPSKQHLAAFFRSLTGLYEEQTHTDLNLIAADGATFCLHQMMLAGCSTFVRDLILKNESGDGVSPGESGGGRCSCDNITIFLPDFEAATVKNLLSILYTGTSIPGCSLPDLKALMRMLKIDLTNLTTAAFRNNDPQSESAFPDVEASPLVIDSSNAPSPNNDAEENGSNGNGGQLNDEEEAMNDEMLEITPEVQMFLGNHFLAGENGEDRGKEGGKGVSSGPGNAAGNNDDSEQNIEDESFLLEDQAMARHKEMQLHQQKQNGDHSSSSTANANSPLMLGAGGEVDDDSKNSYVCRICGKASGNGASLFAHLLYPHYAHLWRTEIPHRAPRYNCVKCNYTTGKRQHFVMHVARVHDELRNKLAALGENLEVLDNLTQKSQNSTDIIPSHVAKGVPNSSSAGNTPAHDAADAFLQDDSSMSSNPQQQQQQHQQQQPQLQSQHQQQFHQKYDRRSTSSPLIKDEYAAAAAAAAASPSATHDDFPTNKKHAAALFHFEQQQRFPRGFKPFVKCRLCGKCWKGKDNFFTHLVSTHFKYMWSAEVPKHADMFHCHVEGCSYQSKYRYNFLFHLAGKHKQLKQKLTEEGIPLDVLVPIETDGSEFAAAAAAGMAGGAAGGAVGAADMDQDNTAAAAAAAAMTAQMLSMGGRGGAALMNPADLMRQSKLLMQSQQKRLLTTPPSALKGGGSGSAGASSSGGSTKPNQNNTRLICRVCSKVSLNHTCHRQHVVGKHFHEFWAHLTADGMGLFNCHHPECTYKTPNRSVFIIHLAYVHQELRIKLVESGRDPTCAMPDVYGKRKYRRSHYDPMATPPKMGPGVSQGVDPAVAAVAAAQKAHVAAAAAAAAAAAGQNDFNMSPAEGTMSPSSSSSDVAMRCKICRMEFPRQRMVVEHLALTHFNHVWDEGPFHVPAMGPFSCQHCPFRSSSRQAFIGHIVSQHEALKQSLNVQFESDKTVEDLIEVTTTSGPVPSGSDVATSSSAAAAAAAAAAATTPGGGVDPAAAAAAAMAAAAGSNGYDDVEMLLTPDLVGSHVDDGEGIAADDDIAEEEDIADEDDGGIGAVLGDDEAWT